MKTIVLPFEEWSIVEPIVTGVHGNAMPQSPRADSFLAQFAGDDLAGVLHVETLYHFSSLYVAPEHRATNVGLNLFLDALKTVPPGFSAIVMAAANKRQAFARAVGARDLGLCQVLRKDVPYERK